MSLSKRLLQTQPSPPPKGIVRFAKILLISWWTGIKLYLICSCFSLFWASVHFLINKTFERLGTATFQIGSITVSAVALFLIVVGPTVLGALVRPFSIKFHARRSPMQEDS